MDLKRIQKFNDRMARPKFSKGGYIKKIAGRKYFDDGGIADNTAASGVSSTGQSTSGTGGGFGGAVANFLGTEGVSANTTAGTNAGQLNTAYTGANNAINAQVGLTNTLTPQAGTAVDNQNAVAQQELAISQGAGPNPAQAQLNQNTATNVANQAALAAGQRGGSANVGLQTRQAAQTGAATQQQAVGQEATNEAAQQVAAQQNLTNLTNNQISQAGQATNNLNSAQQNEQNILQNANTSYNNAQTAMQSNLNTTNSQAASSGFGSITGTGELASILNKGGEVEKPNVNSHKKLDFIHKMAKMGLEHFDSGGNVQPAATPPPKSYFGLPSANADTTPSTPPSQNVQNAQQSMDAAFGGHGNYDDGGTVSDLGTENFAPSEASGLPDTSSPTSSGKKSGGLGSAIGAIAEALAGGGEVNPLVGAIQGNPTNLGNGSYTGSSSSSGPSLPSVAPLSHGSSKGVGQKAYDLYKKYNSKPSTSQPSAQSNISSQNADMASGPSTTGDDASISQQNIDMGAGPSLTNLEAHGGEIWNIHPSQHAQYAAEHFKNYFSKGGESKAVPAMVSPGERYWNPREVEQIKHGADPMKLGTIVPGKDKVPGKDSLKNDTVPATLEEGGIVNPLHVEKTKNSDKARLFVLKSLKATGKHMKKPGSMS